MNYVLDLADLGSEIGKNNKEINGENAYKMIDSTFFHDNSL